MPIHRRRAVLIALVASCFLAATGSAQIAAQTSDYPNRKITFMVGFAPGGGIDTIARVIGQGLADQFGYQVVIENRPGAASNIAARAVASAPADGYTLLISASAAGQFACARGHRYATLARLSGRADFDRVKPAGHRDQRLERLPGAGQNSCRDRHQTQCSHQRGREESHHRATHAPIGL